MKTKAVLLNSKGKGIQEALALTERTAANLGVEKRSLLHLRLLAEELFGMLRGIAGEVEATYWLEQEEKRFELHLASEISLTPEMREQLLAASTSGRNEAAKGFMGKIWVMVVNGLSTAKETLPFAMANAACAFPVTGDFAGESAVIWSMSTYKQELIQNKAAQQEAANAWDELEKSIVANVADEVKVRMVGKNVEIILYKHF